LIANNIHSKYLQSVNNLSRRNLGLTGKNPSVACMIVDYSKSPKGQVLSYGLTSIGGSPHAEVNSLNKISKNKITKKTIMYVSLEPCMKESDCCAKKILKSGIGKVFISSLDPNPLIYGKGLDFLKKNNVKVELAPHYLNKFKDINKIFYNFNKNIRPHITLKLAISKNSFSKNLNETNITSSETQYYMHKYRLTHDAIAVGYNTYIEDKPKLSPRLNGIDKKNFKFVISKINRKLKNFSLIKLNYKDEPYIFLNQLKNYPIKSILIEGGLSTFNYFYNNKLFDEIIICQSKKVIKSSKKRYKLNLGLLKKNLKLYSARSYGEDIIEIYKH
tara:strand:+ start:172 stop:1164 length:993 start_codon:yes stop_codon:yes gene_type:complete